MATNMEKGASTNWAVWSRNTRETVLHLVLKKSHKGALAGLGLEQKQEEQEVRYRRCLDLLLQSEGELKQQLGRVINMKDKLGNTALHYGAQLWGQQEVRHPSPAPRGQTQLPAPT